MNKGLLIALIVIGGIVLAALIFGTGMVVARANLGITSFNPANMMGWISGSNHPGYPMMGNRSMMMGGYWPGAGSNVKPLTIDGARQAVEGYLNRLNNPDLEIKEIMIFDNNAYARITERSTGIGAMELLVDPATLSVFPEYGPNMMWNLKYGHMGGAGGMMGGYSGMMGGYGGMMGGYGGMMGGYGGMMGGYYKSPGTISSTMSVTAEQAVKIAQQYLDQQFPGYQASTDPDPFYGYYTIEILKNDKPTGMLSVHGFSGQVFFHTWHGTFIESSE